MTTLKENKALLISIITIILFSIIFVFIAIFYNDIIIIPRLKNVTREYYDWYLDRPTTQAEVLMEKATYFIKMIFSLIFALEFLYIITNEKYKKIINKRNLAISILIGFALYCLIAFLNFRAEYYRLYMTLIPLEILSLVLLNMIGGLIRYL